MHPEKIIDAHVHLFGDDPWGSALAKQVGHDSTEQHLLEQFDALHIVHGVVMGNQDPTPDAYQMSDRFHYCVGLEGRQLLRLGPGRVPAMVEEHLRRPQCCGIKLYPGYDAHYITDPLYEPYYELAEKYNKPVAFHTGQTQEGEGKLKYCHPMQLDDVATDHPHVQFMMCHFGNPFLADAAAVLEKNSNMMADLSGILGGIEDLDRYFYEKRYYVQMLQGWLEYGDYWDRLVFGTDFPGVNMSNYLDFIDRLIPDKYKQGVMFDNANRFYQLGL